MEGELTDNPVLQALIGRPSSRVGYCFPDGSQASSDSEKLQSLVLSRLKDGKVVGVVDEDAPE
jgi:hypothetical protein